MSYELNGAALILSKDNKKITLVEAFNTLKIFHVDSQSQMKKFRLKSNDGQLEFYLIDDLNQVNLTLFTLNGKDNKNKTIYFDMSLIDLNLNNLLSNKRIEFIMKSSNSKLYYAVEFLNGDTDRLNFIKTINYLKEIYELNETKKVKRQKSYNVPNEIEMKDYIYPNYDESIVENKEIKPGFGELNNICDSLAKFIRIGNVDEAQKLVAHLAKLNLDLKILLTDNQFEFLKASENVKLEKNQINQTSKIEISIRLAEGGIVRKNEINLDLSNITVLDLKTKIAELFKIPIDMQYLIINECSSNDNDLVESFSTFIKNQKTGHASNTCLDDETYIVNVILNEMETDSKKRLLDEETFVLKKQKPCQEKILLENNYFDIAAAELAELNENTFPFDCDICLEENILPYCGVILKECLHVFCKECLKNHINHNEDPVIKCPYNKDYNCTFYLQDREIRALLNNEDYNKFQMRSLRTCEATIPNSMHCFSPDCIGFCISEDNLNFFDCPVCEKVNCLRCNVQHMGKTCKEYQEDLKINAMNDKNAQKDKEGLEKMIAMKKAMYCPGCKKKFIGKIILCKNNDGGCDWLLCAMCKIEICWATRGPRWGPAGNGDTSGGCKCNLVRGKSCHPNCKNCH